MTEIKSSRLEKKVKEVLDPGWLNEVARDVGAVKRRGKIDIVAFVWTLVLGFGTCRDRTLASLRRAFIEATKVRVVPSAFYDRFNDELVMLLRQAVARAVQAAAEPRQSLAGMLRSFQDLVITDSTVIRLRDLLESTYAACRTNHTKAAAKLHVVLSVLGSGAQSIKITAERTHDRRVLQVGAWVKGRLLLFDLGYYCFNLFSCIDRNNGYFISRLKCNGNPLITGTNLCWRGQAVELVGQRLKYVLGKLQRQIIDVKVEVKFKGRAYRGVQSWHVRTFRLVGIYNEQEKRYHLYITNVPSDRMPALDVAQVYRARWEVELLFKEFKGFYGLEDIPSGKKAIVETLILTTVLTSLVSRALLNLMRDHLASLQRRLPPRRFAAIFSALAGQILVALINSGAAARDSWNRIGFTFLAEVIDPNVSRQLNLDKVGVPL